MCAALYIFDMAIVATKCPVPWTNSALSLQDSRRVRNVDMYTSGSTHLPQGDDIGLALALCHDSSALSVGMVQ